MAGLALALAHTHSVLADAVKATGSALGRYPGGTPSDYWDWRTGWASDVGSSPVRAATPSDWAAYTLRTGGGRSGDVAAASSPPSSPTRSILVVNQLTGNLSEALAALQAHAKAGTDVSLVEMGNEMYDSSRPDVVKEYPNGTTYAAKMSVWASAIKKEHPAADVALLAMTWRPGGNGPREAAWNAQVR